MKENKFDLYKIFNIFAIAVLVWFIFAFLILPNWEVLKSTFFPDGSFTIDGFSSIIQSDRAMTGLRNSFMIGLLLPITCSIVGILQVLFIEYFDVKGSKFLTVVYMIPLVFGGLLINNGYMFVYGPNGIATQLLSQINPNIDPNWFSGYAAVIVVMTFGCTINYMIFFRNAVRSIDYSTIEAARNLGASQWEILKDVVLPQLRPVINTCVILLFQQGVGAFSAPLIVGGQDYDAIMPLILTFANRPNSRMLAALLSLFLGVFQIIVLYVIQRTERNSNFASVSKTKVKQKKMKINNPATNVLAHITAYVFALAHLLPFVTVILFSFMDYQSIAEGTLSFSGFTLENYGRILSDSTAYRPFVTSVIYSFLSATVVAVITIYAARLIYKTKSKWGTVLEYLLHIPWLLPSVLFALGMILYYNQPKTVVFNQVLTGTTMIMLIGYIVVSIPNTLRFTKSAFYTVDDSLEEAATILGAKKMYTFFKVILPLILPTVLALFALNFNGKLDDFDLSAFLYHPLNPTLGIVIRNNLSSEYATDSIALNLVYSVILIIINALVVWLVYFGGMSKISSLFTGIKGKFRLKSKSQSGAVLINEQNS
ncbi:2-aminoethylphosphonate transport system permease PhnU [Alloiococcus otitis]|uniref:ABC transmembrane type-1 domain-containing protein n=1 Tax=Alloiococcus otitis ATCC 51267 TaxID=883081 RepID=K9EB84_9LACT|nr:iron ABC transporter permease [Alloiococcus otitis]EKU93888.1 hypothetical protein HMPREF9698_00565 [Alloiococcus otitis ATCC 51267]SUU81688.1 2-aminoethylphosphonate transport system permease PhnU [Alloiococcus otitis]